jgi:hypothetical protein
MRGAGDQIQYAWGDDCPSSGPRRSGRQSLSTSLLIGRMRLSLFCNACPESGNAARRMVPVLARGITPPQRQHAHDGRRRRFVCLIFWSDAIRGEAWASPNRTADLRRRGRRLCRKPPWEVLLRRKHSARSGAVENFESPKHHDDSRYQRGRHQHTFQGSDSHPLYSPLPSPASGLVDSRNRLQSSGHNPIKVASRLWFAGHSEEHGVPLKEKTPVRALSISGARTRRSAE